MTSFVVYSVFVTRVHCMHVHVQWNEAEEINHSRVAMTIIIIVLFHDSMIVAMTRYIILHQYLLN